MNKKVIDRYISGIREQVEKPIVTANFGERWKDYAKDTMTLEEVIEVAWLQGRYAILLERALRRQLENESPERAHRRLIHLVEELNNVPPCENKTNVPDLDIIRDLLPFTYTVMRTKGGFLCESNSIGIADEYWDKILVSFKGVFGDRFQEVFHSTCTDHLKFTVYLKSINE